jgi:hypothetical protein
LFEPSDTSLVARLARLNCTTAVDPSGESLRVRTSASGCQVRAVPITSQEVDSNQILDEFTQVYAISAYFSYFVSFVFELGQNAARAGACRQF